MTFKGPGTSTLRANGTWYHPSFLSVNSFISAVYNAYGAMEDRLGCRGHIGLINTESCTITRTGLAMSSTTKTHIMGRVYMMERYPETPKESPDGPIIIHYS